MDKIQRTTATLACGALVACGLIACATPPVDAQWSDPQAAAQNPLRNARVLVVCEAAEVVLSRICVDKLSVDLQSRGATIITLPDGDTAAPPAQPGDGRYLALARTANATAVWAASVGPQALVADHGSSVSFSLGGFNFGRGSSVGGGVGVTVPVGGTNITPQYAASARVLDGNNGRLLWTARAGATAGGDADNQLGNLAQRLVGAAADAKLF